MVEIPNDVSGVQDYEGFVDDVLVQLSELMVDMSVGYRMIDECSLLQCRFVDDLVDNLHCNDVESFGYVI